MGFITGRGSQIDPPSGSARIESDVKVFGPQLEDGRLGQNGKKSVESQGTESEPGQHVLDGGWIHNDEGRRITDVRRVLEVVPLSVEV